MKDKITPEQKTLIDKLKAMPLEERRAFIKAGQVYVDDQTFQLMWIGDDRIALGIEAMQDDAAING